MEPKKTKSDLILEAALTLFAEKGYDGVGVDEIASAVDMKGPALYHYFKGKEAILEGLVERMEAYYEMQFGSAEHIEHFPESLEEFTAATLERLQFTIHDPQIKKIRRMLMMEQFRSERFQKLTTKHHLSGVERLNRVLLEHLIQEGKVKPYDSELLAFEFTAPVSMLIHMIDREPAREAEAMERIQRHLNHFIEIYKKEEKRL